MKAVFVLLCVSILWPHANAFALSSDILKFIPMKSYEQGNGLPPKLIGIFDLACNETLVKTIRHEVEGPGTMPTKHIFVGALVSESLLSSCAGTIKEVKAEAGTVYSGRVFEVHSIVQGTPSAVPKVVSTGLEPRPKKKK